MLRRQLSAVVIIPGFFDTEFLHAPPQHGAVDAGDDFLPSAIRERVMVNTMPSGSAMMTPSSINETMDSIIGIRSASAFNFSHRVIKYAQLFTLRLIVFKNNKLAYYYIIICCICATA